MFKSVGRKAPRKPPAKPKPPTPEPDNEDQEPEGNEEDEPGPPARPAAQPSTSGVTRRRRFKPGSKFITVIYHSKRLIITSCCTKRDQKIAEDH